jgi:hypothetical protein
MRDPRLPDQHNSELAESALNKPQDAPREVVQPLQWFSQPVDPDPAQETVDQNTQREKSEQVHGQHHTLPDVPIDFPCKIHGVFLLLPSAHRIPAGLSGF